MSVDSRIVTMKFDNATFEKNAQTSLNTLSKLKSSMDFGSITGKAAQGLGLISSTLNKVGIHNPFTAMLSGASKGLGTVSGLISRFTGKDPFVPATKGASELSRATQSMGNTGFTAIEGGITGISNKFLAMSTIAITALSNITNKAIQTGGQLVKSLTTDPIKGGLQEYETNLNSIQTILANTKVSGANLGDVNAALDELNHYSDKTIYNFSEMARNIGTFTAAGVDLDTATSSIKGIANLAALSGSNSQQAASAMYQLSQEIASGRVSLMGWNSVVNAGMGGSTFQRALVQTAQKMGDLDGKTVEFTGKMKNATIDGQSFRDSIMAKPGEQSWLSSKVLTKTLEQFTGDMTDAELAAQGFSKEQIKAIQNQAKTAVDAATKVKTLTGLLDTAKEVVGSGWAKTWQIVFGDFKEARSLFTNASNAVNSILGGMAKARNDLLGGWDELGGRDKLIEGIANAFEALGAILKPIGAAFHDIFPPATAESLLDLTNKFVALTEKMKPSIETVDNLRSIFGGVFSVFHIVGQVIGAVVDQIGRLTSATGAGGGGFLSFMAKIGESVKEFDKWLEKSGALENFFNGLGDIIAVPFQILKAFANLIGSLFNRFDESGAEKVSTAIGRFEERVSPLAALGDKIKVIFDTIGNVLAHAGTIIGNAISKIGDLLASAITPETFSASLDVINTTLIGGIVLMLRKFFTGGVNVDLTGGLFDGIKETLGAATGALQNMQASLKADILLKIAAALAIMTASLAVLAMIDGKKLAKALGAMAVGFAGLQVSLVSLSKAISFLGVAKLPLIAAGMVGIAGAMLLLAGALKIMASIDLKDMIKSLIGLNLALAGMVFVMVALSKLSGPLLRASVSLVALGLALNLIAIALKIFASMSWGELVKGMVALVGTLALLAVAIKAMPNLTTAPAALVALGVAINLFAIALKILGTMSGEEIARSLLALAGALATIAVAMHLMPKGMLLQAAALIAVGLALNIIAGALKIMGSMSGEEIAKSLITLAGGLLILAGGLALMTGTLAGAAALVVTAAALALLTPVLVALGAMDWMSILKALTTLAGVFVVLGLAGILLTPLVPTLLGLGAALVLIGAGLALAGAGAFAFATAFGIIVATGGAGVQILLDYLGSLISTIPKFMKALGEGVVAMATAISKKGPALTKAIGKIIGNMLDAVANNAPKMGKAFMAMLDTALKVISRMTPKIFAAGLDLIIGFLKAINSRIGKIMDLATSIIVNFLRGLARNQPRIVQAGIDLIISYINGLARAIDRNSERLGRAGGRLAVAMVRGMANGITGAADEIQNAALDAAKAAWESVKDFFGIHSPSTLMRDSIGRYIPEGMALGIRDSSHMPVRAVEDMGRTALDTLRTTMSNVSDALEISGDMNPVISPVLDLSQLTQEANKMNSILATNPLEAGVSYDQASDISARARANQQVALEASQQPITQEIKFEQNNHSPKELSAVEIYRNTRNQLSLAKEALKPNVLY
jgi:tape measure domain-containing protein